MTFLIAGFGHWYLNYFLKPLPLCHFFDTAVFRPAPVPGNGSQDELLLVGPASCLRDKKRVETR